MKHRYFKCSVEHANEYQSAGFILKANGKNPIEKIKKFFDKNKWIRYDGVYLPLTECATFGEMDRYDLNRIYQETIFGFERVR